MHHRGRHTILVQYIFRESASASPVPCLRLRLLCKKFACLALAFRGPGPFCDDVAAVAAVFAAALL